MKKLQKGFMVPLVIIIIALLIIISGGYYYTKKSGYISDNKPSDIIQPNNPTINSISPSTGPIGTIVELRGTNLAGFEGDLDAVIENSKGETAILLGTNRAITDPNLIKVKIESKLCKANNSYSGLFCTSYLDITPGVYKISTSPWGESSNKVQFTVIPDTMMNLFLYIQDKNYVATSSCSVTKKITYLVPKTTEVADASLKILFSKELASYGVYKSVSIANGVAKIMLESDLTPSGSPISGLSSCESSHLLSILHDTLTQYSSIKSIELLSPAGSIMF